MTIAELLNIHTNAITPVLDTAIVYAFMENKPVSAYDPFTDSSYTQLTDTELYELTFYVYDHLGNTRVTYEPKFENGIIEYAIKGVFDYYPYGKTLRQYNIADEKYLSTQHERDAETGFDYRGARFYDADIARFLSVDPLAFKFPNMSTYFYVAGNPLVYTDKDGKEPSRDQAGTIQGAIKQWADNGLTNAREIMAFVQSTPDAVRYVYTEKNGWIDLQHYAGTLTYGKMAMDALEPLSGSKLMQDKVFGEGADKSYYSYEDLPSNKFATELEQYHEPSGLIQKYLSGPQKKEGKDLYDAIKKQFEGAGATNPEQAPNYNQIPKSDQDRKRLPNCSPSSATSSGEYVPQNKSSEPYNLDNFAPAPTSIECMGY